MANEQNNESERAETPAQHIAPSQPTSPLPKRFKPDPSLVQNGDMTNEATPTPSDINPPVHTQNNPVATLPHISALLSDSNNPLSMPHVPAAAVAAPIPPLLVQKLSPDATTPTRGSAFAAGYDLYASAAITIKSRNKALVSTSLAIAVPPGTYGRVAPRSGLASKHFLDTGAGVIDADYRGEVKVLMFNFSEVDYEVKQGERIAQLVLERILTPEVVEVQTLEKSVRGAGGFGSTGYI